MNQKHLSTKYFSPSSVNYCLWNTTNPSRVSGHWSTMGYGYWSAVDIDLNSLSSDVMGQSL